MGFDRTGFEREVGVRLQLARKRKKLTQGELATQIGITRATYASVEAGRQRIPIDVVWRAAVILGVSLVSLVPEPLPVSGAQRGSIGELAAVGELSTVHYYPGSLPFVIRRTSEE